MVNNTVNGKRVSNPAGYNSFGNKKIISRTTQLTHGKEEKGFEAKTHAKIFVGELFEQVRDWKENGKPLEGVVVIKAEANKEIER